MVLDSQLGVNGDITKYGLRSRSKVLLGAGKYWIFIVLSSAINRDTRFPVFSTEWSWAVANNDDSAFFRVFVGRPAGGVIGNTNMAYTVYGLYHTPSSFDSDGDGVVDTYDTCSNSPADSIVDRNGCAAIQTDSDNDSFVDANDSCIMTPIGDEVDSSGYSISERDIDGDGIFNEWDECPDTLKDENTVIDSVACEHL
ncbi:thrombospondin type 3 repeat-containing protein [Agarilytica rhodophyticola]|uniref:thrombospondin type 3 repeat-containing protein n=1 Tax=Agarilytica rhodophyticola TaxID=1737490 RepID=UPI000B348C5A|nr:thrombospondin type 3 repeat-containing protein [Agarilytica rhodophyticola]